MTPSTATTMTTSRIVTPWRRAPGAPLREGQFADLGRCSMRWFLSFRSVFDQRGAATVSLEVRFPIAGEYRRKLLLGRDFSTAMPEGKGVIAITGAGKLVPGSAMGRF